MIPAFFLLLSQQAASQVAETPLPETSSFVWADVDGDGRLDLAAIRAEGSVQLLLNAGAGRFEDGTERFGLAEVANAALHSFSEDRSEFSRLTCAFLPEDMENYRPHRASMSRAFLGNTGGGLGVSSCSACRELPRALQALPRVDATGGSQVRSHFHS